MLQVGVSPVCSSPKMAVRANESAPNVAKFHSKCSGPITLSKDRRTASNCGDFLSFGFALSNDSIQNTFKLKVLQKGFGVSPISAASIPHTLDAPYMAGGAVHVIHCCLFFV